MKKVGKHSITMRWLINSLGVIFIILLVIEISLIAVVKNYYYTSARQYISRKMTTTAKALINTLEDNPNSFPSDIRNVVENFEDKDKIELMTISSRGRVTLTSSGFQPSADLPMNDYLDARDIPSGVASSTFRIPGGEKVMAITVMLPTGEASYSAIRMMTSLSAIDSQIIWIGSIFTVILVIVTALMLSSGLYFVKSIVIPVRQIGATARQLATGDFSNRIEKRTDDELGDLCDSINYMAQELSNNDKLKNEFISSVSHELRTPLTAIKGWSETLMEETDPEIFKKGMRVIFGETDRLSDMVEELLDFSRIQNGKLTLQMAVIDILAELGEAVLIYQERAKKLGVLIEYYEPEMLPFVYGDKNRIRQVFINIIDNAIKYSDPGGKVSIEAYVEKGLICVLISDTGIGTSHEVLPKIKNKFYKANMTRRGSGIGLAVADEIVKMHDGTLDINSREGVGTTVRITLPYISSTKNPDPKLQKVNIIKEGYEQPEHKNET